MINRVIKRYIKTVVCLILLCPASMEAEIVISINFHKDTFERIEPIEYTISINNLSKDTLKIQTNRYIGFRSTLEVKADSSENWTPLWSSNIRLTEYCTLSYYDLSPCIARKPSNTYLAIYPGERKQFIGSYYPVFKDNDQNIFELSKRYEVRVKIPLMEPLLMEITRSISDFISIKPSSQEDELILSLLEEEGMSTFDIIAPWSDCGIDIIKFEKLKNIGLKYPTSILGRIIILQKIEREYNLKNIDFISDTDEEIQRLNDQLQLLKTALIDGVYDRAVLEQMIHNNLERGMFVYDSIVYTEIDELFELIKEKNK